MEYDDNLYKAFLEAINDLDNFRVAYASEHAGLSLDREDPDVRRLIEAMAFFSARTHMASTRNINKARLRLFQQVFSFLLTPIPAMGIIQADISGHLQEKAFFPRGTEFLFSSVTGDTALFRSTEDLSVLPVRLKTARLIPMPAKGFRLSLTFSSMYKRNDDIGRLSLFIDYLNDYQNSLYLFDSLSTALKSAFITFDERVDHSTTGKACRVHFGNQGEKRSKAETEPLMHPVQESRFFFHFPSRELFMHLDVPKTERSWKEFTICLDLTDRWPAKLVINKEMFIPFAVPVENLKPAPAEPVIFDGTKERISIRHPEIDARYALQHVKGVYKIENGATTPLRPGVLAGGRGSYEIEYSQLSGKKNHAILLHHPDAFMDPITVMVDALWYQPDFSEILMHKLSIKPYSRHIPGIKWQKTDILAGHAENAFQEETDTFMYLLALRHKSRFDFDDISTLLRVQGSVVKGSFKQVNRLFKGIRVEEARVQNPSGSSLKYIYHLHFTECSDYVKPMVKIFCTQIQRMLDCWISQAAVETKISFT